MDNIIIFSVIFEILTFLIILTLSRIAYKYIQIRKEKTKHLNDNSLKKHNNNKKDLMLTIVFIFFLIASIAGLVKYNIILFIIFITLLVAINIYSIICKDEYISCFMILYGVFNIIMSMLGIMITFNSNNIFLAYIITIALSPLSYSKSIAFIFIIILSLIMIATGIYNVTLKNAKVKKKI